MEIMPVMIKIYRTENIKAINIKSWEQRSGGKKDEGSSRTLSWTWQ